MKPYQESRLWKNVFGVIDPSDHVTAGLASEYASAWDKACGLAKRIAIDAQGLTLHDEQHFARLWKCADIVAGAEYKLSKLETFVFGVAILVHDAAHTVLAYEGGLDNLKTTPEWEDAIAAKTASDNLDGEREELQPIETQAVLFDVLRTLHAKRAESILKQSFKHPAFGSDYYLINDPTIRDHFGYLIGKIAASHHWNVSQLEALGRQQNATPPFDRFGPIRPMVLGALMRTADAIQFDAGRAPDFEFALTQPNGVSKDHWSAQNRLSVEADLAEPSALLVTSSSPFAEAEAASWWVAFDLASNADRELRATEQILRGANLPTFAVKNVKDTSDPASFSKHVTTANWQPVDAQVKVNDTAKVVKLLGGRGLYGDDTTVPLRELIQNSVDAVRARRLIDRSYDGRITVNLCAGHNCEGESGYWLSVADDGIGMSSATMMGPFLSFGDSGWNSAILRTERPGFVGKRFKHIGRYGIGFFSVFMIGHEINVTSRPYESGASDAKTLSFRKGLQLRPLVRQAIALSMSVSTSVEVFITQDVRDRLLHKNDSTLVYETGKKPYRREASEFKLRALVEMLCPAIDVAFDVAEDGHQREQITADWKNEAADAWLERITGLPRDEIPEVVTRNSAFVETITLDNGHVVGRGSLNPTNARLAVFSVGGLAEKRVGHVERGGRHHVGCIDTSPIGPKRDVGVVHSKRAVASWANRQVARWMTSSLDEIEKNFIAANAAHFGGDPTPIANCLVDNQWLSLAEVFDRLDAGEKFSSPIRPTDGNGKRWSVNGVVNFPSGSQLFQDDIEVSLTGVLIAGPTAEIKEYWAIPDDDTDDERSFIGCLGRYAWQRGKNLRFEGGKIDFGFYRGQTIHRQGLHHGSRLVIDGIVLDLIDV